MSNSKGQDAPTTASTPGTQRYGKVANLTKAQANRKKRNRILARIAKASRKINRVVILLLFPFFLQGQTIGGSDFTIDSVSFTVIPSEFYENHLIDTLPCKILVSKGSQPFIVEGFILLRGYHGAHSFPDVLRYLDADRKELEGFTIWNYTLK